MIEKELKTISKRLKEIEVELKSDWGLDRINGGFVHVEMEEYDKDTITISITDGVQSDCTNDKKTTFTYLLRDTLEFKDD